MTGDDGFIFQLTPSRRATERRRDDKRREGISTHALTEGDRKRCAAESHTGISTHALTEGDEVLNHYNVYNDISTHALTEGDMKILMTNNGRRHFNSRPHGGRSRSDSIVT